MSKRIRIVYIGLFLLITHSLSAQTGSWTPPGADTSYPRTLLQAAAVPQVQAALADPVRRGLYAGIYRDISGAPTTDNTSADGRRARATFAKNAAFVVLLNRKPLADGTLTTLPAAEQEALVATVRSLLETSNPAVEAFASFANFSSYNEWQWRSKELIDYLIAYDMLRGAGTPETTLAAGRQRLQTFAGNLHLQSTKPFLGISFYNQVKNNHTLMTAAALGMAAVVLPDATSTDPNQQPRSWINTGLMAIENVLWQDAQRQSDPAAVTGYAEGPYYFKYAFLNCLPFFRAMGHFLPDGELPYTVGTTTRTIRNPYFDPRYDRLYDWITAILLPDGRLPALEDSYVDMGMPELALTGKRQYVVPLHLRNLASQQLHSLTAQLRDVTVDMRAAYLAANLAPTPPTRATLTALPQSGNLVFRSGNDSLASYLHVYGKGGPAQANSGGHSQADASSFLLHAHGQLLALDAGYLSYGRRGEVGNATNHNMVLVDGAGPAIGAPSQPNDAAATIPPTAFQTPQLAFGEVQTTYQNTRITRKTLFVRNSYYLLADFMEAAAPHTYTWQLHGYGLEGGTPATGTFSDELANHEGLWEKNGVQLRAHVTATGGATTYQKATSAHELTYNIPENHTTLLVQKANVPQTQFLAVLYPFVADNLTATTTSTATTAAITTQSDFTDLAFTQADTVLTTTSAQAPAPGAGATALATTSPLLQVAPNTLSADGLLNFYSADDAFAQLFTEQGRLMRYGATTVLQSSRRATISWQKTGPAQYTGYVSRSTSLTLTLPEPPRQVSGATVADFSYDNATHQLHLELTQPGNFTVATGQPLPVQLVSFTARRQGEAVQLSWQTATEQHSHGFVVERSTNPQAGFQPVAFVRSTGQPTTPTHYQFLDQAPAAEPAYYRLQQQDTDGTASYSPVVAVVGAPVNAPTLLAAPIPASDVLYVSFSNAAQEVTVQLLNQQGQVVLKQALRQQATLNISSLAAGLYYLQAVDATGRPLTRSQKVLVQ